MSGSKVNELCIFDSLNDVWGYAILEVIFYYLLFILGWFKIRGVLVLCMNWLIMFGVVGFEFILI